MAIPSAQRHPADATKRPLSQRPLFPGGSDDEHAHPYASHTEECESSPADQLMLQCLNPILAFALPGALPHCRPVSQCLLRRWGHLNVKRAHDQPIRPDSLFKFNDQPLYSLFLPFQQISPLSLFPANSQSFSSTSRPPLESRLTLFLFEFKFKPFSQPPYSIMN